MFTPSNARVRGCQGGIDPWLVALIAALVLTWIAFARGALPYPFGTLVIVLFVVARVLTLRRGRSRETDNDQGTSQ